MYVVLFMHVIGIAETKETKSEGREEPREGREKGKIKTEMSKTHPTSSPV